MFRKNIMAKPGHFVFATPLPRGRKAKAEIVGFLSQDHIKMYNRKGKWPARFADTKYLEDDAYDPFMDEKKHNNRIEYTVSSRRALCSASKHITGDIHPLADKRQQERPGFAEAEESDSESEDDMPYIEPNTNLKKVTKMVYIDESSEEESDEDEDDDEEEEEESEDDQEEESEDEEEERQSLFSEVQIRDFYASHFRI